MTRILDFFQMKAEADGTSVMDALYANKASLETIFNIIDADHSGSIYLARSPNQRLFNLKFDFFSAQVR